MGMSRKNYIESGRIHCIKPKKVYGGDAAGINLLSSKSKVKKTSSGSQEDL